MIRFILLLLFIPIGTKAQHCVGLKMEKDEFTGASKKSIVTPLENNLFGPTKTFKFRKINDNFYLDVYHQMGSVVGIREGAKIMLKLSNDSVVTLYSIDGYVSDYITVGTTIVKYILPTYKATEYDFSLLAKYDCVKYRIYYSDGYVDYTVKSKFFEGIKKSATCIIFKD